MPGDRLPRSKTQVLIAQQRTYLDNETILKLTQQIDELGRILSGLIKSLTYRDPAQD